jgi:hypothetical protein
MSWTIEQQIDEIQFHIDALRSIILANAMNTRPCLEIQRTLSFAMGVLRERREKLIRDHNLSEYQQLDEESLTE